MAPAAFWRAWSIWAVSVAATATGIGYTAVHPLPAKLANGNGLDVVVVVVFIAAFAIAATGLAAIVSLAVRYRRARTAERAQLKWLLYAGALIVAALLAEVLVEQIIGSGTATGNLQNAVLSGAVALVAVAIGIAVLRYRLYDIDRVISRTVAYTIVTGLFYYLLYFWWVYAGWCFIHRIETLHVFSISRSSNGCSRCREPPASRAACRPERSR